LADVFPGVTEKIEVGKESVLDNLLPREGAARRKEIRGGFIILCEGGTDGSRTRLQGIADVLAEAIA
jgi:hypothetical protein